MNKKSKTDYKETEWQVTTYMCDTCFKSSEGYEVTAGELCEECEGSYEIPEYNYEDEVCMLCKTYLEYDNAVYKGKHGEDLICNKCYNKL